MEGNKYNVLKYEELKLKENDELLEIYQKSILNQQDKNNDM